MGLERRDAVPLAARIKLVRSITAMKFGLGYKSATLIRHDIEQAARRKQGFLTPLSHTCIAALSLSWSPVCRHSSRLFSLSVVALTATCEIISICILHDNARYRDVNLNNQIDF